MSIVALGDKYFVTALRAVGVDGRVVHGTNEAENLVDILVKEAKCKIIIVSEKVASNLDRKRDELAKYEIQYPIFAVIPGLDGGIGKERTQRLYELISQAVGAKLKLGGS